MTGCILLAVPTLGTRDDYLRRSLRTVADQSDVNIHVVVVGPTGSRAATTSHDFGFDYEAFDRPGLSNAVNHIWRHSGADYEYVAWLGDDDGLAPGALLAARNLLDARPSFSAVYGRIRVVWADGSTQCVSRPGRFASVWLPYGSDRVPQVGTVFRRSAVEAVGWLDPALRYAMDYDLFLRLKRWGPLGYVNRELGFYRQHPEALSYNKGDDGAEADKVRDRGQSDRQVALRRIWQPVARPVDFAYGVLLRHVPAPPPALDPRGEPYGGLATH